MIINTKISELFGKHIKYKSILYLISRLLVKVKRSYESHDFKV